MVELYFHVGIKGVAGNLGICWKGFGEYNLLFFVVVEWRLWGYCRNWSSENRRTLNSELKSYVVLRER